MIKNLILSVALVLGASSCLGPNQTTVSLWEWNNEVSESEWVNEGVFLGLNIIPVYPIAILVDVIVFNSIEFWTHDD